MFEFDFRNVIVLISLGIHATLIWLLAHYGRKQVSGRAYLAAILAIAGWVIPMIFYRAHYLNMTLLWARILYAAASFTSTSFFIFTLTFPENKVPKLWVQLLVATENLAIIYLTFHPTLFITGVTELPNAEDTIHFTKLYFIYAEHISLFFLAGFVVLIKKIRKNNGIVKQQLWMIFWGYFLASNLAMTTNLWMPWKGNFELNWIGQFFSTLVAGFTTYAILKHRFITPKVIVTEILIIVLNFILFVQIAFSETVQEFLVRIATLLGVLVVSIGLLKSVLLEVRRREEMEKLKKELEIAYGKLKVIDEAKTDFLSMASHQLRSPLTVVRLGIGALLDGTFGDLTDKRQTDALNKMLESSTRLINLIGDYLNVSRIELGKIKYDFKEQDLYALIKEIVEEYQPRAKEKGLKLQCRILNAECKIRFDEEKLRHVLANLIDNAIKYTTKGSIIVKYELITANQEQWAQVSIKDTGLGLKTEEIPILFQKFRRAEGKNLRRREGEPIEGSGLGLHVAKMFVEKHGGKIWAESKGLNKGSVFSFSLPLSGPPPLSPEETGEGGKSVELPKI